MHSRIDSSLSVPAQTKPSKYHVLWPQCTSISDAKVGILGRVSQLHIILANLWQLIKRTANKFLIEQNLSHSLDAHSARASTEKTITQPQVVAVHVSAIIRTHGSASPNPYECQSTRKKTLTRHYKSNTDLFLCAHVNCEKSRVINICNNIVFLTSWNKMKH